MRLCLDCIVFVSMNNEFSHIPCYDVMVENIIINTGVEIEERDKRNTRPISQTSSRETSGCTPLEGNRAPHVEPQW